MIMAQALVDEPTVPLTTRALARRVLDLGVETPRSSESTTNSISSVCCPAQGTKASMSSKVCVLVSLVCFMFGAAFGARIARSPKPDDPVWPPAVTAALAIEVPIFIAYAACWWAVGARPDFVAKIVLLGLGATALGIQSSTMQRFGAGLNTTFLSGSLTLLVGQLATGHRFRDIRHHLVVLVGLVCGGALAALLVLHAPMFAPVIQLAGLAVALGAARWHARTRHRLSRSEQ